MFGFLVNLGIAYLKALRLKRATTPPKPIFSIHSKTGFLVNIGIAEWQGCILRFKSINY